MNKPQEKGIHVSERSIEKLPVKAEAQLDQDAGRFEERVLKQAAADLQEFEETSLNAAERFELESQSPARRELDTLTGEGKGLLQALSSKISKTTQGLILA